MTKKTTSKKPTPPHLKTATYNMQKLQKIRKLLQSSKTDEALIKELEQLILDYTNATRKLGRKSHLDMIKKLKKLKNKVAKTEISKAEQQKINKALKKIEHASLRKTDEINTNEVVLKPLYFFAGEHSNDNEQLLQKLQQFNINCSWLSDKDITNAETTTQPSLFLFECTLLDNDRYANLLKKRATKKNQINIALYRQPFPSANIRAKVLNAGAELVDFYDFPELIKTLHHKSHAKKNNEVTLFMLLSENQPKTKLQKHLESSAFNLAKFTCIEDLLDALNDNQADAVLVAPSAYNNKQLPLSPLVKQQSTQIHVPIINIYTNASTQPLHQLPIIATRVDDNCDFSLFKKGLLKRIEQAEVLKNLISQDRLTGLYTHSFFLNTIRVELKKNKSINKTLVMLDIDHFKKVNDLYGHQAGDSVLQNLSLYLKQHLRHKDPIGRYGGEEFAILLDVDENQAFKIIDKIRTGFASFKHTNGKSFKVTFSCGLAPYTNQGLKKLIKQADEALYQAKKEGRNRCKIYNSTKP